MLFLVRMRESGLRHPPAGIDYAVAPGEHFDTNTSFGQQRAKRSHHLSWWFFINLSV